MRSAGWIGFVAGRYIGRGRKNSPSPVLAILGIATGVLALIVILAVMNGFQLGFIESILEISSYHLRAENFPPEKTEELEGLLRNVPGVTALVPFREFQALVRGRRGQQAALIRGLPPDAARADAAMGARLEFESGFFDLAEPSSILLGAELARRLSLRRGDELEIFSVSGILSGAAEAAPDETPALPPDPAEGAGTGNFTVSGVFRTGFYEYDLGWGFVNIESALPFSGAEGGQGLILGIKLKNRWQDRQVLELLRGELRDKPGFENVKLTGWRDYNRAFFGALRTEKLFMFILVGLIFIVVGLNIYQGQRRSVLERREEIGLLRAVGGGEWAVRLVFVCDGAIIGFTGAVLGLCPGLLVASHIPLFFTILEGIVNFFIRIINAAGGLFGGGGAGDFAIFSPAVFYIKEIPSRVIPREVLLICMFGFLSALLAAWFASGKVSRIRPAEALRYE
ncbi:MAG: ABC transporter permease [Treponema sp.]|jgi:lipoprotein-releasing system permease protein|nr:ABC transporter permease [Treponema sp.]